MERTTNLLLRHDIRDPHLLRVAILLSPIWVTPQPRRHPSRRTVLPSWLTGLFFPSQASSIGSSHSSKARTWTRRSFSPSRITQQFTPNSVVRFDYLASSYFLQRLLLSLSILSFSCRFFSPWQILTTTETRIAILPVFSIPRPFLIFLILGNTHIYLAFISFAHPWIFQRWARRKYDLPIHQVQTPLA